MANVKVPALLHKMSKAAQKAWYKKNNMTMPSEVEGGGRSAAAAKRVVAPAPRKQMAAAPQSVRAMNTARQQAYYAKGGRQPIGAGGSGGSSSMAGVGQSSAKEIIKGIKAGYNPKVALVRYTNEEVEQVDEVTKKEAEETLGGPVKTKPKMPPGKQPEGYRYVRALARRAMKAGLKKEEVEQVDEVNRNKTKTDDYGGRYLDSINRDKEIKELERKISKMSPNDGGGRYLAGLKLDKMKAMKEEVEQVDEVNARNSFVATQQALTPRAKDVKASVGTTRRDAAVTNKYARRISKLSGGDYSKQDVKGNLKSLAKEEAEGKVAVTPKEKSLAAHHGDKTKITFGDVLKARLKSAAAKKMGK
jgi:ribosomal protein S13